MRIDTFSLCYLFSVEINFECCLDISVKWKGINLSINLTICVGPISPDLIVVTGPFSTRWIVSVPTGLGGGGSQLTSDKKPVRQ